MRRTIVFILLAGLIAALSATPSHAGKKKKHVHDTFGADLLPFPKLAAWGDAVGLTKPGCSAGQENVHWVGQPFTSPGKGTLRFYMEGFTGDHDIYVFAADGETALLRGENNQTEGAPPEEELILPMTKGQKVVLVACNWLGQPQVEAHYEGTFK